MAPSPKLVCKRLGRTAAIDRLVIVLNSDAYSKYSNPNILILKNREKAAGAWIQSHSLLSDHSECPTVFGIYQRRLASQIALYGNMLLVIRRKA